MPELPDVEIYRESLAARLVGQRLLRLRLVSPFVLRTWDPPAASAEGRTIVGFERLGKRIVWCLEGDLFLVVHLMVAGRFRYTETGRKPPGGKIVLADFVAEPGTVTLTEAGTKKRAALHVLAGREALRAHDPGGLEPLTCDLAGFTAVVRRENHTLKRCLTDPRWLSGIGNAWSDEILCAAGLSPLALSASLSDEQLARLFAAVQTCLQDGLRRLRESLAGKFPGAGEVTAFRPEHAVHGKYGQPCGRCGATVQRIVYAESETNYCPCCQTGGRVLADRSLSRLLRDDWPRSLDDWEARVGGHPAP